MSTTKVDVTTSPADELRKAAETLRERAEDATPGTWRSGGNAVRADSHPIDALALTYSPFSQTVDADQKRKDAIYIATMHPGVGLALADWLDTVGADVFAYGPPEPAAEADDDDLLSPHLLHGLALARLINGAS